LSIGGMTCASCASRIEKKVNLMNGATATVNYATEKASVTFDDHVTPHRPDRHGGQDRLQRRAAPAPEGNR
jgi:cation transport ATPase